MTGNMILFLTVLSMTTPAFASDRLNSEDDYGRAQYRRHEGLDHVGVDASGRGPGGLDARQTKRCGPGMETR